MNVFTSLSRNEWVLEQRHRKGLHGTTVPEVPGLFGERHELALAANSGTMTNDCTEFRADITFPRTRHQNVEPLKKI
eukprot:2284141-Pyramimonas_sp.AAC.1